MVWFGCKLRSVQITKYLCKVRGGRGLMWRSYFEKEEMDGREGEGRVLLVGWTYEVEQGRVGWGGRSLEAVPVTRKRVRFTGGRGVRSRQLGILWRKYEKRIRNITAQGFWSRVCIKKCCSSENYFYIITCRLPDWMTQSEMQMIWDGRLGQLQMTVAKVWSAEDFLPWLLVTQLMRERAQSTTSKIYCPSSCSPYSLIYWRILKIASMNRL